MNATASPPPPPPPPPPSSWGLSNFLNGQVTGSLSVISMREVQSFVLGAPFVQPLVFSADLLLFSFPSPPCFSSREQQRERGIYCATVVDCSCVKRSTDRIWREICSYKEGVYYGKLLRGI